MIWLVLGILVVIGIAFIYSNMGMGGGILYVPLLLALTGFNEDTIVPISLALILASTLPALFNHVRSDLSDLKLGLTLATGAIIGSMTGALFNLATSKNIFLIIYISVVLIVIAKMIKDWQKNRNHDEDDDDSKLTNKRIVIGLFGSFLGGFLSGCLGIGGGVINVPILIFVLGRSTKKAAGTSFVIILISAIVGICTYVNRGLPLDWEHMRYIAIFTPAVLASSFAGSRWGIKKLNPRIVRLLFIMVLLIAVVKTSIDLMGLL